jgi:SWI/SNF-related matrix-associated actin-dependent regulator of chromatin subfamily A3
MSSLGKRSSEWIDLTADDDDIPRSSRPQKQVRRVGGPASSSQPQASQSLTTHDQWGLENGEDEIIDLSQDVDEGHEWTNMGSLKDKIVGVRYYNGLASPGEQVLIKREPGNPYDRNAIRVNNVLGAQIGHLPKTIAAKLASYLVGCCVYPLELLVHR